MFARFKNSVICGGQKRSKSTIPKNGNKVVASEFLCVKCQRNFPNKAILSRHLEICNEKSESTENQTTMGQDKNALNSSITSAKDLRTPSAMSKYAKNRPGQVEKVKSEPNKTDAHSKNLSDTFSSDKPDGLNQTVSDKKESSFISNGTTYTENSIHRLAIEILKKPPKARREAELDFITRNIDKKTPVRYLIDERWIENYTQYLNGEHKHTLDSIDNENLKHMVVTKTLPSNVYLVNEIVWRFVYKIYGGGPEIKQVDKSISFSGNNYSDRMDETRTADTFSRSEGVESLRGSLADGPKSSSWDISTTPYLKPQGLANPSFFCYMNSSLQMLAGITELSHYIYQEKYKPDAKSEDPKFWRSMTEFVHGHFRQINYITPKSLRRLSIKNFNPDEQHDTHEFLNFLLSGMQDEINPPHPKKEVEFKTPDAAWSYYRQYNISIIDDLLAGQLISTVKCKACKHVSTAYDPFLDLCLPIIPGKTNDLDDCLSAFQKEEEISDSYKCEKCKALGKAVKQLRVHRYPRYLVINLKRFENMPRRKLKDTIEYPVHNWKLYDESTKSNNLYSLVGIIVHRGAVDSGHYVCYSKRGSEWILCDDENISKTTEKEAASKEAYVLIYEKNNSAGVAKL